MKRVNAHEKRLYEARPGLSSSLRGRAPIFRNKLYLTATSGVDQAEIEAIHTGLMKIQQDVRSQIKIFNLWQSSNGNGAGPFEDADWYQDQAKLNRARGHGQQLDIYKIDRLLREEPYQINDPHLDVMVVDHDLTASTRHPDNNFVYGMSSYPNIIISTKRIKALASSKKQSLEVMAVVAAHELGHTYGLADRNFNIGSGVYRGGHCNGEKGECLIEQSDVPGCATLIEQTRAMFKDLNWLCEDCLSEAEAKKINLEQSGVLW